MPSCSQPFFDQLAVAFGGELLVLELLHKALRVQVGDSVRTHPHGGLDDVRQFKRADRGGLRLLYCSLDRRGGHAVADPMNVIISGG